MKTKADVLKLIDENGGEWKPSEGISFKRDEDHDNSENTICYIKPNDEGGKSTRIMCFPNHEMDEYAYVADTIGPVETIDALVRYCSVLDIEMNSFSKRKVITTVIEKKDEISNAKLSVYEKIFRDATKITIDNK